MKCTVLDVLEAHEALARHGGMSLQRDMSMRFARFTRAIRTEAETAHEVRKELIESHLVRDAAGDPVPLVKDKPELGHKVKNQQSFDREIKVFGAQPAEIPGEPFKLSDLGDGKIASDLLAALHFAIVDG